MARIASVEELADACKSLRFPVVLKTAEEHAHRSDVGGVVLSLPDADAVHSAYEEMAGALGPKALIAEMAPNGVELALGSVWDKSFGPIVLITAGGVLMEFLNDKAAVLAPFDESEALRLLRTLRVFRLLQGVRGQPPADLNALAKSVASFSRIIASLGDTCGEIDINPLVCTERGPLALDCLIVPRQNG
jgi:acetyltransferase